VTAPLAGRVAVITGASRGLGAGLADHFASQGVLLGLCARTRPAERAGCVVAAVDMTDDDAVDAFVTEVCSTLGPIDLWVNNAGVLDPIGPVRDVDPAAFAANVAGNLQTALIGSRAFLRHRHGLADPAGGVLVNISSGAGRTSATGRTAYAGWGAYGAAKAGVDRLTAAIALEEADAGLRAYAVAPGVIDTDMQATIRATPADRFPAVDQFHALKADGAFATPAHIAEWLLALAFDPDAASDDVFQRVPPP